MFTPYINFSRLRGLHIGLHPTVVLLLLFFSFYYVSPRAAYSQSVSILKGRVIDTALGEPLVGANVVLAGTATGTTTDTDGAYTLELEVAGEVELSVSYIGYVPETELVTLVPGETVTKVFRLQQDLILASEVVVLGSRSIERSAINSAVPVDVLTPQDIRESGSVETAQVLQMLIPSFDFKRVAMGDALETVRPVRIRGLGPDQSLVLINGKRRHVSALRSGASTAGVDFNAIPAFALGRAEVLRDGASAQYGADAVAGVVNFQLSEETGTKFALTSGVTEESDGETVQANLLHGLPIGSTGFVTMTGEFRLRKGFNRAGTDGNQQFWGTQYDDEGNVTYDGANAPWSTGQEFDEDAYNAAWAENPQTTFWMGDPEKIDGAFFVNSEIPLEDGPTFYAFGGVSSRYSESGCYWRRPNQSDRTTLIPGYERGFLPRYNFTTTDMSLMTGFRGTTGAGYNWDFSLGGGGNAFDYNMGNIHNASLGITSPTAMYLGTHKSQQITSDLDLFKTYDVGTATPLAVAAGVSYRAENYQINPGDPESYINGGQTVQRGPNKGSTNVSVGAQCYPGYTPADQTDSWRQNIGAFVDLETDVLPGFFIGVAGRFEHYDDFGSTVTGKVSSRLQVVDGFAVRGAVSTGFKAPAPVSSFFSSTQTGFFTNAAGELEGREVRSFRIADPAALALGAKPLKPEKSFNVSAGIAMDPIRGFTMTADYYRIQVNDRIVRSSNFFRERDANGEIDPTGIVNSLFAANNVAESIDGGRFVTNAVKTLSQGVDIVAKYGVMLGRYGSVRLIGSANFQENRVDEDWVDPVPDALDGLGLNDDFLFDELSRMEFEEFFPRSTFSGTVNYRIKGFTTNLRLWRPGEVSEARLAGSNDVLYYNFKYGFEKYMAGDRVREDDFNTTPAKWLTDIYFSYTFENRLTFGMGVENLLNIRPPKRRGVTSYWDEDAAPGEEYKFKPNEDWADIYEAGVAAGVFVNDDGTPMNPTAFDKSFRGNFPYVGQFNSSIGTRGRYYFLKLSYSF